MGKVMGKVITKANLLLYALAFIGLSSNSFASTIDLDGLDIADEIKAVEDEIKVLELKLAANRQTLATRVEDLKVNSPLFAKRSPFESDVEFLARSLKGNEQIKQLHRQYLSNIERRLHLLRNQTFKTTNICVELEPNDYKPNKKLWPMRVNLCGLSTKAKSFSLPIDTTAAKYMWESWDEFSKTGLVMLHPKKRVELVQLDLVENLANQTYRVAFPEYITLKASKQKTENSQGHASKVQFTNDSQYLLTRMNNELGIYDLVNAKYHHLKRGVVGGPVVHNVENGLPIVAFFTFECVLGGRSSSLPDRSYGRGGKYRKILNVSTIETSTDGVPSLTDPIMTHAFPLSTDQNEFYLQGTLRAVQRECERNSAKVSAPVSLRFNADATAISWNNYAQNQRYAPTKILEIATGKPLTTEAAKAAKWTSNIVTQSRDKRIRLNKDNTQNRSSYRRGQSRRTDNLVTTHDGKREFNCVSSSGYIKSSDGSVSCIEPTTSNNNSALSPNGDFYAIAWPNKIMVWRTLIQTP